MIKEEHIRLRVRHFLLQQSEVFQKSIAEVFSSKASVIRIAEELSKKTGLSERRLQKYLAKDLNPKELSITLPDLSAIANLKNLSLSNFIAYLAEEKPLFSQSDKSSDKKDFSFLTHLHEGQRRLLNGTIFSDKNLVKSEMILDLMIEAYTLTEEDIKLIGSIIYALKIKNKHERGN